MANLRGSLMHARREQNTPNADPAMTKNNVLLTNTPTVESVMQKYNMLKPEKIGVNQVRAIEVMITASPEFMNTLSKEQQIEYLKKGLAFSNTEFGGEKNLLHAEIHLDETTAHLTAFYIPIMTSVNARSGKEKTGLNAKKMLGGKKEFSDRQTRFYEQVSKNYGLERGEIGSKATHKRVQDWYRELDLDSHTADSLVNDLKRNSVSEVKVEVEQSVKNVFGLYTGTETVQKTVGLGSPKIDLADLDRVLSPYLNSNAKMKRNEKAKLKHEARKELEEELKDKIQQAESYRASAETELREIISRAYDYHRDLALKFNLFSQRELEQYAVDLNELEQAVLNKVDELQASAVANQRALELEKEVYRELAKWKFKNSLGQDTIAFLGFDEYARAFEDNLSKIKSLREENKTLQDLSGLKQWLKHILSDVVGIVGATAETGVEVTIQRLVEYVKDMSSPVKIKALFDKQCEKYKDDIRANLAISLDERVNLNRRSSCFNLAYNTAGTLQKYMGYLPDDILNEIGQADEKIKRDRNSMSIQSPRMRM